MHPYLPTAPLLSCREPIITELLKKEEMTHLSRILTITKDWGSIYDSTF